MNNDTTVTDNCSTPIWSNNYSGLTPGICGSTGTASVTYTASDICSSSNITINFDVIDTTPPSFTAPGSNLAQDLTIDYDANTSTNINNWLANNGNAVAVEICGNVSWSNDYSGYSAVCPGPGTATVTFTAEDECGNTSTTTATLTINDNQAPTIDTPPLSTTAQCDTFNITDYEAWRDAHGGALASDACSTIDNSSSSTNWSYVETYSPGCNNTGVYDVTFTVTDDCGFTAQANASYTVIDNFSPTISPLASNSNEERGGGDDQTELESWIDSFG